MLGRRRDGLVLDQYSKTQVKSFYQISTTLIETDFLSISTVFYTFASVPSPARIEWYHQVYYNNFSTSGNKKYGIQCDKDRNLLVSSTETVDVIPHNFQLRALKTKRTEEVAYHLLEVFTIFGAPHILHSDNGRELAKKIIEEVCSMWDELKIVHGKPRHSQSQGSVERANQDIEKMLATWLETNKMSQWSKGIKFIQFMKNRAYDSGISCSPYEALFGYLEAILVDESDDADDGAKHRGILDVNSTTEDSQLANVKYPGNANCPIEYNACAIVAVNGKDNDNGKDKTSGVEENEGHEEDGTEVEKTSKKIQEIRDLAKQSLIKQADRMLKHSNDRFPVANVGKSVRVQIPEVDKVKADSRNIIVIIISVEDERLYKLGTKHGILNQVYARNEFTTCKETLISVNDVPGTEISFRKYARKDSNLGGQGFRHCNCSGQCNSNRCRYKKASVLCNSKCHENLSCKNK
ncbi:uncharacterized protein [Diabrotica undecimpunctata]|uniref:uncharacterized protein n=1 Tax=Diabrotica undecimpunctata TaxID=50387 RepID=UPI003B639AED